MPSKHLDEVVVSRVGKYPPEQRLAALELINSKEVRRPADMLSHLCAFPPEERPQLLATESSVTHWYEVMEAAKEMRPLERRRAFIQAGFKLSQATDNQMKEDSQHYCKMGLNILKELPFGQSNDSECAQMCSQVCSFVSRVGFACRIPQIVQQLRNVRVERRVPAIQAIVRHLPPAQQRDNDFLLEIFLFFLLSPQQFSGCEDDLVALLGDNRFDKGDRGCMIMMLNALNNQQLVEVLKGVKLSEEERKTGVAAYDLLVAFRMAKYQDIPAVRERCMRLFQSEPIPDSLPVYDRNKKVDLMLAKAFFQKQKEVSDELLQKILSPFFHRTTRVSILRDLLDVRVDRALIEWAAESIHSVALNDVAIINLVRIIRIASSLGNGSKEKRNALTAVLIPLLRNQPNRQDLLILVILMPPDSLEFIYTGLAKKPLVKMLQDDPELKQKIYQHLQKMLSGIDYAANANKFAKTVIKAAPLLLLHEEHPLFQLALEVAAKSDPEQMNKENNPFKLHQNIKEKVSKEPLIALEMPSSQIAGQTVSIDLDTLRKRSEKKAYTFKDLPSGINLETVERLFGNIEARLNALPPEKQNEAHKSLESEFGFALKDLIENILDLPLIPALLMASGGLHDPVENTMFYLFAILKAVLAEDATVPAGELLSPQEKMFLACARNIRACPTGQRDAITNYFNYLPSPLKNPVQGESKDVERLKNVIDQAIQVLLNELLASEQTFKALLGTASVPQLSHQTLYLKNRLYRQIGIIHRPILDFNSGSIESQLIERLENDPKRALEIIFSYCPPERVIAAVKKAFAEEFKHPKASQYMPLSEFFEAAHGDFYASVEGLEEGRKKETKYLRFKSFRPKELTDFGALSLLTGLVPYLNKRESINRESMAIDSRFPHERPPAEEPLAKCHKLDPKMLR